MPSSTKAGWVLAALFIGVFMENLDHTVMATVTPSVVAQIGGMQIFTWVFSVYLLTSTIFIPIFGKLADQYGKKPFLLIGFATFVAASALSANAETMGQLIAYRALQGLGAAPLLPIAFSAIFELVGPEKQGRTQALFASLSGFAMLLGPLVGSFLTDRLSWHWVFWINVPLGLAAMILVSVFYKERKSRKRTRIDYGGAAALALSIAPLMLALVMGGKEYAWTSWPILALFGLSILFAGLFLRIEQKTEEPIIALGLFNKKLTASVGIGLLSGIAAIAVMTYIPFYIQGVMGGTTTHVGTINDVLILALIAGTGIGGHLAAAVPARTLLTASVLTIAAGAFLLSRIEPHTSDAYFYAAVALFGLGAGPLFPATTMLAQSAVQPEHTTSATSLLSFFRNIGMAVGSSLLAVIVNRQMLNSTDLIRDRLSSLEPGQLESLRDPNILMDARLQSLIPEQALDILRDGLSTGITQAFAVTIGIILLMIPFSLLPGKDRLAIKGEGRKIGFH